MCRKYQTAGACLITAGLGMLLGLLLDAISEKLRAVCTTEFTLLELQTALRDARMDLAKPKADCIAALDKQISSRATRLEKGKLASSLSNDDLFKLQATINTLEADKALLVKNQPESGFAAFNVLKSDYDAKTKQLKKQAEAAGKELSNVFAFCEQVFNRKGQELLILVTELTINYHGSHFISRYGCDAYFRHNKDLLFYERQREIIAELDKLDEGL